MVSSIGSGWQDVYETCCVLQDRFLLLGHATQGVQLLDLATTHKRPVTILWMRVKQILALLRSRVVLMMPAGRGKRVRCYSLDSLLCLCHGVCSLPYDGPLPSLAAWQSLGSKKTTDAIQPESVRLSGRLRLVENGSTPVYVCDGVVLQDYYYKLPGCSKDCISMHTYQTTAYVFVAVLQRDQQIVVWQQRLALYSPLVRHKSYWVPTEPRAIAFADDRATLRYLVAVFPSEATVIGLRNCKVDLISVDMAKLQDLAQSAQRLDYYEQNHHLNDPPAPLPLQWTSLLQLPFYPDGLPATSLTTAYSNPPAYTTVMAALPSAAPDPVAVPCTAAPQLFLATLGRQSFIIDLSGSLFSTAVYCWSQEPDQIEFVRLQGAWCAVGFGSSCVEIIHLSTTKRIHRIMNGVPVRYLGRSEQALLWTCAVQHKVQLYMLRIE